MNPFLLAEQDVSECLPAIGEALASARDDLHWLWVNAGASSKWESFKHQLEEIQGLLEKIETEKLQEIREALPVDDEIEWGRNVFNN